MKMSEFLNRKPSSTPGDQIVFVAKHKVRNSKLCRVNFSMELCALTAD